MAGEGWEGGYRRQEGFLTSYTPRAETWRWMRINYKSMIQELSLEGEFYGAISAHAHR